MEDLIINVVTANKPESLLVFVILLLYAVINTQLAKPAQKIALIYILGLLFVLLDVVEPIISIVGCFVATFLVLEVFSSDEKLVRLFSFSKKALDWAFRMMFEYYMVLLIISIGIVGFMDNLDVAFAEQVIGIFLLVFLSTLVCRQRFSRRSISGMLDTLMAAAGDPALCHFSDEEHKKLQILLRIEDKGFCSRRENQHTFLSLKSFSVLRCRKKHSSASDSSTRVKRKLNTYFRGYSTIEMQLIRTIGLRHGSYRLTVRRKFFELVYSHLLFNGYIESLSKKSPARQNIKKWIMRSYLELVSVKIGEEVCKPGAESTFKQLYDKEFNELSSEEFMVWCIGLRQFKDGIGPVAVSMYEDVIKDFSLNRDMISEAIDVARNASRSNTSTI